LVVVSGLLVTLGVAAPRSSLGSGPGERVEPTLESQVGEPATGWGTDVTACPDRELQVESSRYSPPCFTFTGDNGGRTTRGVTTDTIKVAFRTNDNPTFFSLLARLGNVSFDESVRDWERTAVGLVDYFNENFEFYGRRLELVPYFGRGQIAEELTGGGRDNATNDAVRVAQDIGAFADVTALSRPYAEALSDREVVNIGAPFMPREWFTDNAPYAWSSLPSCTIGAEAGAEFGVKRQLGKPAAFAGGELHDRIRTVGVVIPNDQEWKRCGETGRRILQDAGYDTDLRLEYVLDLTTVQTQAADAVARLKAANITSVVCGCDPLMLMYMTARAEEQNYEPEWLILGTGFIDLDLIGQMITASAGDQWLHATGSSPLATPEPPGTGEAYRAYRSVRDDEPSLMVDLLYHQLLLLAIGIQMAGPDLRPETFESGMFAFPQRSGAVGTWKFSADNYTGVIDAREIWWDPDAISPWNGQPGTYLDNGTRYEIGHLPTKEPDIHRTADG
jgi:hypothetical protein